MMKFSFPLTENKKNELASFLYKKAKEINLINNVKSKYKGNQFFSSVIFSEDEIQSILNYVICKVIISYEKNEKNIHLFEVKNSVIKKLSLKNTDNEDEIISIVDNLINNQKTKYSKEYLTTVLLTEQPKDFSKEENLVGYFVNAFENQIYKTYNDQLRQKRKSEGLIYIDKYRSDEENSGFINYLESKYSTNPESQFLYEKSINSISHQLQKIQNENREKEKPSFLADIFEKIVVESASDETIKKNLGITTYILNNEKKNIISLIKKSFPETLDSFREYLNS